jgi:phosphate transport system protein
MRVSFPEQLSELTRQLGLTCELTGIAMRQATKALLSADLVLAETAISKDDEISALSKDSEEQAYALLATRPTEADLRAVVGQMQVVIDLRRMGALARHVGSVARRRHPGHAVPADVHPVFAEMGEIAVALSAAARQALLTRNPVAAAKLQAEDDAMDALHQKLFSLLLGLEWRHGVGPAVDVALLGRYYERFADHAVQIGRRIIFAATGAPLYQAG